SQLQARNEVLAQALQTQSARYGLVGRSSALLQALGELERVSRTQATVLLLGQSGTGKELFARALHLASDRHDHPFIKVNCAAIPESLFESELFGHDKGAFTGAAASRAGWFEQADSGTLFLDEIGELPLALQAKLLRTLQEGTLVRLGGRREVKVNVRLVAATHRDLAHEVQAGRFRQELYYRLNVIPIRLPSLAERREDIRALALHLVSRANQAHQRNVYLTAEALARLEDHPWPGNIRELGNVIERLVLLSDDPQVTPARLERFLPAASDSAQALRPPAEAAAPQPEHAPGPATAAPLVREYAPAHSHSAQTLQAALQAHQGNQSRAARALGMTLRQFSYRLRKAGLR
ncbi:MAG: sigma-54 interaction domain-containing protein, partial [Acidovorax sp.]